MTDDHIDGLLDRLQMHEGVAWRNEEAAAAELTRLRAENAELALLLRRALRRMKQYEMDVDATPPRDHRQFMKQATDYLERKGLAGSPLKEDRP